MFSANSSQVSGDALYVEDVFSTYLYTGTNANQTITNNIDLSGKGGMVLLQCRSNNTGSAWNVYDTQRGAQKYLVSSGSREERTTGAGSGLTSFNSNGFTLGTSWNTENFTNYTYASWTFREAPKFFDVVTYTGNGSNRTIAHSLGAVPGCIIIKRLQDTYDWQVYHRSNANTEYMVLNSTAAKATGTTRWNSTTPTATEFSLGTDATVNASGGTYVAYLFGHDTTSDGIIQCGSFTTDGSSNATVSLGWEPQWVLLKGNSAGQPWITVDQMRGFTVNSSSNVAELYPNSSSAEVTAGGISPTSTGFTANAQLTPSTQYIYIAIRRGPMRTPTSGTSVFSPNVSSGIAGSTVTTNFRVDFQIQTLTDGDYRVALDRLRGTGDTAGNATAAYISTNANDAETASVFRNSDWLNNSFTIPSAYGSTSAIYLSFSRAPSFFDEVCYKGNGTSGLAINHNLGVAPELMIVKCRSNTAHWAVYHKDLGASNYLFLSLNVNTQPGTAAWGGVSPTATQFSLGSSLVTNTSGYTYVAYLFASCPGVSKVGSYTGNGSSQTINCGFTAGARFVMIKRTNGTGDWYVWNSASGIIAGNDPHISLNTSGAQVTTNDSVDTDSSGFVVNDVSPTNINLTGATYIYLAVA